MNDERKQLRDKMFENRLTYGQIGDLLCWVRSVRRLPGAVRSCRGVAIVSTTAAVAAVGCRSAGRLARGSGRCGTGAPAGLHKAFFCSPRTTGPAPTSWSAAHGPNTAYRPPQALLAARWVSNPTMSRWTSRCRGRTVSTTLSDSMIRTRRSKISYLY